MGQYYTVLILFIDAMLLAVSISLAIIVVGYTIIKKIIAEKRYRHLTSIISALQALAHNNKGPIIEGCYLLMRDTTPFELLDIAKHREDILPVRFSKQLSECISASVNIRQVEEAAQRSMRKWHRIEALTSLGYFNSPRAAQILKESVFDKDEDIAYFSLLALGHIKDVESVQIFLEIIKRRIFSGYKIASILEYFPESIASVLIKNTEDPDPVLRFWCIKIISRFKPKQYTEKIVFLTDDALPDIRAAACECLGEMRERSTRESVKKCLKDKVWFVRMHAVRALEKILGEDCLPDVVSLLNDSEWFLRENVKKIMIKHIDKSLAYIEQFLGEYDKDVKESCLEMLDVSGYSSRMLENIISKDPAEKNIAIRLLRAVIGAGEHSGLEGILGEYPKDKLQEILEVIQAINKEIAGHIEKKINGGIVDI